MRILYYTVGNKATCRHFQYEDDAFDAFRNSEDVFLRRTILRSTIEYRTFDEYYNNKTNTWEKEKKTEWKDAN